jgi:hypothetical protein
VRDRLAESDPREEHVKAPVIGHHRGSADCALGSRVGEVKWQSCTLSMCLKYMGILLTFAVFRLS